MSDAELQAWYRQIEDRVRTATNPVRFQLVDDSSNHSGNTEGTHIQLVVVSDAFLNKTPVARHQLVYKALATELAGKLHALSLHLCTAEEWAADQRVPDLPDCAGS